MPPKIGISIRGRIKYGIEYSYIWIMLEADNAGEWNFVLGPTSTHSHKAFEIL